jgi:hypothetical protein
MIISLLDLWCGRLDRTAGESGWVSMMSLGAAMQQLSQGRVRVLSTKNDLA